MCILIANKQGGQLHIVKAPGKDPESAMDQAREEAKRLAEKHPGTEFFIYPPEEMVVARMTTQAISLSEQRKG
jgi:hypothetical protein